MERWVDIDGYKGFYQISSIGRIRSVARISPAGRSLKSRILKQCEKGGVRLWGPDGKADKKVASLLVSSHFLSEKKEDYILKFKDGNPKNRAADNLMHVKKVTKIYFMAEAMDWLSKNHKEIYKDFISINDTLSKDKNNTLT